MPYALIPDGYSLKKVTKAQKSALDEHNRAKAVARFAGTAGSPILLLVVIAAGLFYLASQFKLPGIDIRDTFQAAFPQLSAILGIKGELSQEAFDKIMTLIDEGAVAYDPNASVLAQTLFPTPEKRAEKKEIKEQLRELGL
jgi:hypothetical protein